VSLVDSMLPALGAGALFASRRVSLFVIGVLLFWLAAALHYLLIAFEASRAAERRALELSVLARDAELRALRAQLDPHFLFNSLNSISALTVTDPAAARRMCVLLADFLRDTLRLGGSARIPLGDELRLADRFLEIERVRLGPRLQVARDTDPAAATCLVPPLLLQPLVENAVVHGIDQLVDGGTIRIAAARNGSGLTITLDNPCDPDRPRRSGTGLGLELLRQRLETQFGAAGDVRVDARPERFRVEVRIPCAS
jgi:LytS/YehU family sensor histidine kinase